MTIGDRIKNLRIKCSVTQTELAQAACTTKQNIYKYENGIITNIPSDKIELIASYLGVSPGYLMGWEDEAFTVETNKTLPENLKKIRISKGLNKRQMSELLDMPYTTYNNYETGAREPNSQMLIKIAETLNVSTDYLLTSKYDNYAVKDPAGAVQIDGEIVSFNVVGRVAAGYDNVAIEEYTGDTIEIPLSMLRGYRPDECFALSVKGDSMYPKLLDGDVVIVYRCPSVDSGSIAVLLYNGDEATIKKVKYVYGEDWLELIPINPEYQVKRIEGPDLQYCQVLGKVIKLVRDM